VQARVLLSGLLVATLAATAPACGPAATPAGVALPSGCGPRSVPRTGAAGPAGASPGPLPAYGAPVLSAGLAAAPGGRLLASTPFALYTSADDGSSWSALPLPAGLGYGPTPLVAGAGDRVAGVIGDLLEVSTDGGRTWRTAPPVNVMALAVDPAEPNVLAGLGGTVGPKGSSALFLSADWGATFRRVPLPVALLGSAVVVDRGTAWAAVGSAAGPAHLYQADLGSGPAVDWTPAPPAASAGPVLGMDATPGGGVLLLTTGGLFTSAGPGAAWTTVPLPAGPAVSYLAVDGGSWYIVQDAADDATSALWSSGDAGRTWRAGEAPSGYLGQPVADGAGHLWLPAEGGPFRLGPAGGGAYRSAGIPAPISFVASAALRTDQVVAGWSGGLLVSTDGGAHFTYTVPPGSDPLAPAQVAWTPDGGCLVALFATDGTATSAFLSGDAGGHWTPLPSPVPGRRIAALVEYPTGSGIWWASADGRLYRTGAGRLAWHALALPDGATPAQSLAAGSRLWVGSGTVGGVWSAIADARGLHDARPVWGAGFGAPYVATDPYDSHVVYAGLDRSLDAGAQWNRVTTGPADWVPGQTWPKRPGGMTFLPDAPGAVLVDAHRLLRDDGSQWRIAWQTPRTDQFITGAAAAGPALAYAAVQGLGLMRVAVPSAWQTPVPSPAARRWTPPAGWPVRPEPDITAAYPSDPHILYRVSTDGRLFRSADGGTGFGAGKDSGCCPASNFEQTRVSPTALAVSPTDPATLMLGLGTPPQGPGPAGLLITHDGGGHWLRTELPAGLSVVGIAMASSQHAFAAAGDNLWETRDGGTTWRVVAGPSGVTSVAAGPDGNIIVGGRTRQGGQAAVWITTDGGAAWYAAPIPLPEWRLTGGPSAVFRLMNGALFAGGAGLVESVDGGGTWTEVSGPMGDPFVATGGLQPTPAGTIAVRTQDGVYQYRP